MLTYQGLEERQCFLFFLACNHRLLSFLVRSEILKVSMLQMVEEEAPLHYLRQSEEVEKVTFVSVFSNSFIFILFEIHVQKCVAQLKS